MAEIVVSRMAAIAGRFPPVCICCGASTATTVVRTGNDLASRLIRPLRRSRYDWWTGKMDGGETALDIVKWTVNKSFARKCRIQVPVCEVHIAAWKRREQASFFFKVSAVFAFPLIFGLTMFNTSVVTRQPWIWTAAVGAVGMAVFLGLAVRRNGGFAWPADFRMKSLTDAEIHFVDVSPTFVAAMNPADDDRDSDESSMP